MYGSPVPLYPHQTYTAAVAVAHNIHLSLYLQFYVTITASECPTFFIVFFGWGIDVYHIYFFFKQQEMEIATLVATPAPITIVIFRLRYKEIRPLMLALALSPLPADRDEEPGSISAGMTCRNRFFFPPLCYGPWPCCQYNSMKWL